VILYKSAVTIARPPDVVFPYLIDPALQAKWSDIPMKPLSDGPVGVRSRFERTLGAGPLKAKLGIELTAVEPGRRMVFSTFKGPLLWEAEYILDPSGDGTQVRQDARLTFQNLWRVIEPFVGESIKKDEARELQRLKEVVEAA